MNEYIKKSEAVDVILKYPYDIAGKTATAIKMIEDLPSADAVPKSEYDAVVSAVDNSTKEFLKLHDDYQKAKREVDRLKYNLKAVLEEIPETKRELASEIFAEIESLIDNKFSINHGVVLISKTDFAELKKKYTEGTYNSNSNELDILKSTITHKEEDAYNKGYEDAKADILEKLQADIARDEVLAEYGDELFEGRIAGFKAIMNYLNAEGEE